MNYLLNICQGWEKALIPRKEELKELESTISVQDRHVISVAKVKEWFLRIEKTKYNL